MRALALCAAVALLPGCAVFPEDEERSYQGQATGYSPTNSFLKVNVREADGNTSLFDFDRRDWYTAEIARRVDGREIDNLTVQGKARQTLGEILVLDVLDPAALSGLRYDKMDATPEARQDMDSEHDALLRSLAAPAGALDDPALAPLAPTALP